VLKVHAGSKTSATFPADANLRGRAILRGRNLLNALGFRCEAAYMLTMMAPLDLKNSPPLGQWSTSVLLAASLASSGLASGLPLRIGAGPRPLSLDPLPQVGAVFVFAAPDLPSLGTTPEILFQSNTPLPEGLRLAPPVRLPFTQVGFFRASFWAGIAPALVDIPAGTFLMGTPPTEAEAATWEGLLTAVTLTYGFKMGRYEVTQAEYQSVMGKNPSYYSGVTNRPVEQVTWDNAMDYCARLTASQQAAGCLPAGWLYRLPTEAKWEYACRAGTTTAFAYGTALRSGIANFVGSKEFDSRTGSVFNPKGVTVGRPSQVGNYTPNAWGLYDLHGNLWEWCLDRWSEALPGGTVTDPRGISGGENRVVRGGCWYNSARICKSSYRAKSNPGYIGNETGFRVVLVPK